jgi:hypothetical protein
MGVRQLLARFGLLKSSRTKKRAIFGLILATLLATLAAERQRPIVAHRRPALTFYQLDVEFDGDRRQKTQWGAVDLRFVGSEDVLYFNLTVQSGRSGSPVWRLQNLPVLSREGPNVRQTATFHFDLANAPGDRVPFLEQGWALTPEPFAAMPELAGRAHVGRRDYAIDTGYSGVPITFVAPLEFLAGGPADGAPCSHEGFPNQEAKKDECVPAATSNSLNWMNELYGLGIATEDITLEAMKGATGWSTDIPGCDDNWPDKKESYLVTRGIAVSTEVVERFRIDRIRDAICAGCDVELGIGNHCVAVTGIQKLEDGNYTLDLTHDSDQKRPGGTITETAKYDNVFGRFEGDPWLNNKAPELIVVECPFGPLPSPTPTPSRTPTRTHTPTPGSPTPPSPTSTPTPTLTTPPTTTPSVTPPETPTPTPPLPTETPTPSVTPTPPSPTATETPTPTPGSPTPTPPSPTATPVPTP